MTEFKNMRQTLGLSQPQLARKLKVSLSTVVGYEREPTEKVLVKMRGLIENFGISLQKQLNEVQNENK